MTSTWVSPDPLRHPWFAASSLKRKHSESSDDDHDSPLRSYHIREPDSDNDGVPMLYPTSVPGSSGKEDEELERKRRRCDTIERRMARMYIESQQQNNWQGVTEGIPFTSQPIQPAINGSSYYTYTPRGDNLSTPVQYSVEEPISSESHGTTYSQVEASTPPITEVRMKGAEPSWYEREKDRIVITDLDEAIEEAEEEYKSEAEPHPNASDYADTNANYSISSVLLEHIKKQANFPYSPPTRSASKDAAGALIVYRPPPLTPFPEDNEDNEVDENKKFDGPSIEEIDIDTANAISSSDLFETNNVSMEDEPMDMDMDVEL